MDTRFSSAIHMLVLIAESPEPMSSRTIAESVGTNASYIRRLSVLLKKAWLIDGHQGVSGFVLSKDPKDISLMDVYRAVYEQEHVFLFDMHENSDGGCAAGKHIRPVLEKEFREIEKGTEKRLKKISLYDCIKDLKREAEGE